MRTLLLTLGALILAVSLGTVSACEGKDGKHGKKDKTKSSTQKNKTLSNS